MADSELLTEPGHSRSDLRMVAQAIAHGWNIPETLFDVLPKVAGTMAINGKPKERLAAMTVLLKMKEQNDRREPAVTGRAQSINIGVAVGNVSHSGRGLAGEVVARLRTGGILPVASGIDQGPGSQTD